MIQKRLREAAELPALLILALFLSIGIAQEEVELPKGPAPRFFIVTRIDEENIELKEVGTTEDGLTPVTTYKVAIEDIEIYDASGNKLGTDDFLERVVLGSVVLVAADENEIDPADLSVVKGDTLVLLGVIVRAIESR